MRPYESVGSTKYVDFNTTKETYQTDPDRCPVSHVVSDSGWESKLAQTLEAMPEVMRYVKNQALGFSIPYSIDGDDRQYFPDFIAVIAMSGGPMLNLIVEVTGEKKKDKEAKVATARTLWTPAVNNHGGFGRWGFVEIADPWDAAAAIRKYLAAMNAAVIIT